MSAITDAFNAAAREFLKEAWVRRGVLDGTALREKKALAQSKEEVDWLDFMGPHYPAALTHFVEVEIDGELRTFGFRIKPVGCASPKRGKA